MLYSIVGVGLNAMPMAAVQDALTNMPLCLNVSIREREDDSLRAEPALLLILTRVRQVRGS